MTAHIIRHPDRARLSAEAVDRARSVVAGLIRSVPDFPRRGILFRDITPVLADPRGLHAALELHLHHVADLAGMFDKVAAIESRGFLFGMSIAERYGAGFVPVRKPGKLPAATLEQAYTLEYGLDRLQIHVDAIARGDRVVVVDDLLATGGTARTTCELVERLGGRVVAALFLVELEQLGGRGRLGGRRVEAILQL